MDNTLLTAAGAAMAAAIGYLFKIVMALSEKQAEQGEMLGEFRGRQEGITQLSADVLAAVHDSHNCVTAVEIRNMIVELTVLDDPAADS